MPDGGGQNIRGVIQLTYARIGGAKSAPARLARRALCEVSRLPCRVGAQDCALPGVEGELFELTAGKDGSVNVCPVAGVELCVCGEICTGERCLSQGDVLTVGGFEFSYHFRYQAVGLSVGGRVLSWMAKCLVCVFLAIEVWVMCGLPSLVSDSGIWEGSLAKQRILRKVDELRHKIAAVKGETPLALAIVAELSDDLNARARYLRQYSERMSPRQRRTMMSDLKRIDTLLKRLADMTARTDTPELDVDYFVKKILDGAEEH